jgi:hypothetical protein
MAGRAGPPQWTHVGWLPSKARRQKLDLALAAAARAGWSIGAAAAARFTSTSTSLESRRALRARKVLG